MNSLSQATIQRMYQLWPPVYELLTPIYLLGNEGRLYRETTRAQSLQPHQAVRDVG